MVSGRRRAVAAVVAASALAVLFAGAAAAGAPTGVKPCKPLKRSEITAAFGVDAGKGTAQGSDCTWRIDERTLSLEVVTEDAKLTFEALRDLNQDAGFPIEKIRRLGDAATFAPSESFKVLLVLEGKSFLFFRVLDIASPMDAGTARTALVEVAKKAVKRV